MKDEIIDFKYKIDLIEIKELCDLALEIIRTRELIERYIVMKEPYSISEYFGKLSGLCKRFILKLASTIRTYAKVSNKDVEDLKENWLKWLMMTENEFLAISKEIEQGDSKFPKLQQLIQARVDELIYGYFIDIIRSVNKRINRTIKEEFVISAFELRGISVSPAEVKSAIEKKEVEA